MRRLLPVVAWPVTLVTGALVAAGLLTGLLLVLGASPEGDECDCGDTGRRAADVVVTARIAARQGDDLRLEVESVEQGRVRRRPVVRSFGVQLRPWREYRLWLFRARGRPNLSREVEPEVLGFTRPVSVAALGTLPSPLRWGVAAAPPFLAASTALVLHRRREDRLDGRRRR